MIHNFQKLEIWQLAVDVATDVYRATAQLPGDERFGMTSQVRRAASSVAANIAEGAGRGSAGDFKRFLRVARGSANELQSHLLIASRVGLISDHAVEQILGKTDRLKAMLHAFSQSL